MVEEEKILEASEHNRKSQARRKQIITQIVVGVIIFISGIVVGSGGTIALLKNRVIWIHQHPKKDAATIAKQIGSKYGLTDEQTQRVEQIFANRLKTTKAVHKEFDVKMEAEYQNLAAAMKEALSLEQFERWHKDFEARRDHRKKMFESKMRRSK